MTAGRKDKLTTDILSRLTHVSRDLSLFTDPTPEQRKAKERFWGPFMAGDIQVPPTIDLPLALRFGGDSRISKWWDLSGFQDWFLNQEEFRQRVEFIAHLALDSIEEVLKDRTATSNAKVAAAKLALEVANKLSKGQKDQQSDGDSPIDKMDRKELEEFIRKKLVLLPIATDSQSKVLTVDVTPATINAAGTNK